MRVTSEIDVQSGPPDLKQLLSGSPASGIVSALFSSIDAKHLEGKGTFLEKWREIVSTSASSKTPIDTILPQPSPTVEETRALPSGKTVQPIEQGDIQVAAEAIDLKLITPEAVKESVAVQAHPTPVSTVSNRRGTNPQREVKIAAKPCHSRSTQATDPPQPQGVRSAELTNVEISISAQTPSYSFTAPLLSDPAPQTGAREPSLQSEAASDNATSITSVSSSLTAERPQNQAQEQKAHAPDAGIDDSSIDGSIIKPNSHVEFERRHSSPVTTSLPIDVATLSGKSPEIRNETFLRPLSTLNDFAEKAPDLGATTQSTQTIRTDRLPHEDSLKATASRPPVVVSRGTIQSNRTTHDLSLGSAHIGSETPLTPNSPHPPSRVEASPGFVPTESNLIRSTEAIRHLERPYQVLDAFDERLPNSHWTAAAGRRVEAGFQDPTLGWVSVRAQTGAGGIHAVVVPISDTAAQVLNTHLAGLNAHLGSQYENLSTVTLASPNLGFDDRSGTGQSAQHDHRDNSPNDSQHSPEQSQPSHPVITPANSYRMDGTEIPSIISSYSAEGHVSVIA